MLIREGEVWVNAIKANRPEIATSNFDYAGRLTETVVLGVVALRALGACEARDRERRLNDELSTAEAAREQTRIGTTRVRARHH